SSKTIDDLIGEAQSTGDDLTRLENHFSAVLGEGARWLKQMLLIETLAATVAFLLLGLALAIRVSRGLSDRLERLRTAMWRVASGDYGHPLEAGATDEIGQLTMAFHDMARLRERADVENRQLTHELERRLEQLKTTNEDLES